MSSLIGHSLVGLTIFVNGTNFEQTKNRWHCILWSGWFVLVAIAPDFDYIVPFLHPSANDGLRITHSIVFCQILPLLTQGKRILN